MVSQTVTQSSAHSLIHATMMKMVKGNELDNKYYSAKHMLWKEQMYKILSLMHSHTQIQWVNLNYKQKSDINICININ